MKSRDVRAEIAVKTKEADDEEKAARELVVVNRRQAELDAQRNCGGGRE